jgi:hypothetical protein
VYDLAGMRRLGCRRDWVLVKVTAEGGNPTTWEEMVGGSVGAPGGREGTRQRLCVLQKFTRENCYRGCLEQRQKQSVYR